LNTRQPESHAQEKKINREGVATIALDSGPMDAERRHWHS
jgi:hypothetical protein